MIKKQLSVYFAFIFSITNFSSKIYSHPVKVPAQILGKISSILNQYDHPQLLPNQETFTNAIKLFGATPGFSRTLLTILNGLDRLQTKGHIYEIEKAVMIAMNNKSTNNDDMEIILGFNQKIKSLFSYKEREFDIITTKRLIECKNIDWQHPLIRSDILQLQFLEQNQIVEELNTIRESKINYLVCSKQPIPKKWTDWFKVQKISYQQE